MNANNSTTSEQAQQEQIKVLKRRDILRKTYVWGVINHKLPVFKTWQEEEKHFGKPLSEFDKKERAFYNEGMERLEEYFEIHPTARLI